MKKLNLGVGGCISFPLLVSFSPVLFSSFRADNACLLFSYCKILCMQYCKVFLASHLLANSISYRLLSHTSLISAPVLSLALALPGLPPSTPYRQSFAVLAKLVLMIYTDHNILTECIFWEFFNFPTVMKYVLSVTLFPPLKILIRLIPKERQDPTPLIPDP